MTRRERLENKLAKRGQWAEKRKADAEAKFKSAENEIAGIPPGQPILVGHHSEKHHRRDLERHDSKMLAGIESEKMAAHHEYKAAGIENQLKNSIFSDDPDAVEAIEARIAELEAQRERMKTINALYKKGDAAGLAALGVDLEKLKAKLQEAGSYWGMRPHLPYELSNLSANIKRNRDRLADVKIKASNRQYAADNGGMVITPRGDYALVTFAEYPGRPIINALKAAGFHWNGSSWNGYADKIPDEVKAFSNSRS